MMPPSRKVPGRRWRALLLVGVLLLCSGAAAAVDEAMCAGAAYRTTATPNLPTRGRVTTLVIFARFADEVGSAQAPAYAADLFDPDLPGSLRHFYAEMSRRQFDLDGESLPRAYAAKGTADSYISAAAAVGDFGRFTREILAAAEEDVDYGRFDNDGPDGVPNSGDDDGYVDVLFIVTQSIPTGFILGDADGVARLGLDGDYRTADAAALGGTVRVRSDASLPGGTLQRGLHFTDAVSIMAHEFGHLLGLPDLYDRNAELLGEPPTPADESAGIGYWGLMGHGTRGWDDRGGPNPFCAWSLKRLGWLGIDNSQLVIVEERIEAAPFVDVSQGGRVYQLPLAGKEYFLVEHRSSANSYYERHLPAEGLLIWHVRGDLFYNDDERAKLVDLVAADGLYSDAGYPAGMVADNAQGSDNLDFWSTDDDYRVVHAGNLGDATDVYDGQTRTEFTPLSNPAINRVSVRHIRPVASGFVADLDVDDPQRAGVVTGAQTWSDSIEIVGDLLIEEGAHLRIAPGTVIRVAADGRRTGLDSARVEIVVAGLMTKSAGSDSARFVSAASDPRPGDWSGIVTRFSGQVNLERLVLAHAVDGLVVRGATRRQELSRVTVRDVSGRGLLFDRVSGEVILTDVGILRAGGDGLTIDGGGPVTATRLLVRGNGGHGIVHTDGTILLSDSELIDNGGADLWLGENTRGTVSGNLLRGSGTGVHLEHSEGLRLRDNRLVGHRLAVQTSSASPWIQSNVFTRVDTVLTVVGFRVPVAMQLNVIEQPGVLVVNDSQLRLDAERNWWGTDELTRIEAGMAGLVDWRPPLNFDPRLPIDFSLAQSYPNPFNGQAVIEFSVSVLDASLRSGGRMTVDVRNVIGGRVRRLLEADAAPGRYRVVWDGRDDGGLAAASGVYYYELSVGGIYLRRRLTLLR